MTTIATKYPFVGSIETRQGGRQENQDNAGFVDTAVGLLLVVCDGMGGGPGGRTASLMAVDAVLQMLETVAEHTSRQDALRFAIEKANDVLYAKAKETPELMGMGTTVAAMIINEESAVIAHCGDSRIYQLRKGTIVFRSTDHSYVAKLVREKKLTEEEARQHPKSNVITRALGIRPSVEVELDEVTFQCGDRFVLCTDGIWGAMPQKELVKELSRVMGIEELVATTADEVDRLGQEAGGGHDNLTLAVLDTTFDGTVKKIKPAKAADDAKPAKAPKAPKAPKDPSAPNPLKKALLGTSLVLLGAVAVGGGMYLFGGSDDHDSNPVEQIALKELEKPAKVQPQPKESSSRPKPAPTTAPATDEGSAPAPSSAAPQDNSQTASSIDFQRDGTNVALGRQVKEVNRKLGELKNLQRGATVSKKKENRRKYITDAIEPDLNQLGDQVKNDPEKGAKIQRAKEMLKSDSAVKILDKPYKKSYIMKETNDYIDKVIDLLNDVAK